MKEGPRAPQALRQPVNLRDGPHVRRSIQAWGLASDINTPGAWSRGVFPAGMPGLERAWALVEEAGRASSAPAAIITVRA